MEGLIILVEVEVVEEDLSCNLTVLPEVLVVEPRRALVALVALAALVVRGFKRCRYCGQVASD